MLEGQVAMVTGGARGIGRGICVELARAGVDIAVGDLLGIDAIADEAKETVRSVEALGRRAITVPCDVTRLEGPTALVDACLQEFGRLDIVVANAGVLGSGPVKEMEPAEWDRVMSVNATGCFLTNRAALPHLCDHGGGSIVNISSMVGMRASANRAHYSASKFAVIGFSQALAAEVADDGVRVNCIAPGGVRSGMTIQEVMDATGVDDPVRADEIWTNVAAARLPFERSAEPADIGRAVVYLCGAEMVSGTVLPVTGGEDLRRPER